MDYRVYHAINRFVEHHSWIGRILSDAEKVGTPAFAIAAICLWALSRPGNADRRWKLASASALAAAALALLVNQLIAAIWHRDRPFQTHPASHVWGSRSHDPSFPSDHTSAAFAIAFTVFLYDRLVGGLFLGAAVVIGFGRVVVGAHYLGDVLAGVLVGIAAALIVTRLARQVLAFLVRLVERITDPLLAPAWRMFGRR